MSQPYMLDTNILSDLIRNPAGRAAQRVLAAGVDAVCTSIIVAGELRYGAARRGSESLSRKVEDLLTEIRVLPFGPPGDAAYAALRVELETAGQPIGGNDMLIAAHAQALGAVVVTANEREFRRVSGLKVENWLE